MDNLWACSIIVMVDSIITNIAVIIKANSKFEAEGKAYKILNKIWPTRSTSHVHTIEIKDPNNIIESEFRYQGKFYNLMN